MWSESSTWDLKISPVHSNFVSGKVIFDNDKNVTQRCKPTAGTNGKHLPLFCRAHWTLPVIKTPLGVEGLSLQQMVSLVSSSEQR